MATIEGLNGAVALPTGFYCKFNTWSATVAITVVDTSGFTDNGWKTVAPVQVSLSGSAAGTGIFNVASASPINSTVMGSTAGLSSASGSFTLTATTGCTLGFSGTVTQVGFSRPVAGKLDVTYNFESSGQVTQTWDETP